MMVEVVDVAGIQLIPDTEDTRKALQDGATHQFILKMYQEIQFDLMVCEIEGWDKKEFINMLYEVLNHFHEQIKS